MTVDELLKSEDVSDAVKALLKSDDVSADAKETIAKSESERIAAVKAEADAKAELAKATKKPSDGDEDDEGSKGEGEEAKKAEQKKADEERAAAIAKAEGDTKIALQKADEEIKKARADAEAAQKTANESNEIAKGEREIRVNKEFVAKAATFEGLPITPSTFGPILKAASEKLSKEDYEALMAIFKAADEQIKQSELFKEMGRTVSPEGGDSDVFSEVQRKAEELRKSDSELTAEKALQKALDSDPDLARRYLAEVR